MSKREEFADKAASWVGTKEGSKGHKQIVSDYNKACDSGRKMDVNSLWCAGFVGAVAQETGNVLKDGIGVPVDYSCGTGEHSLIEKAKKAGIWIEDDAYTPRRGDIVIYDWKDNGKGDDVNGHDHTGIVTSVAAKSFVVTEGNKNNAVGTRRVNVNAKNIRGFISPKFADEVEETPAEQPTTPPKSISELADEVIAGKWGNNPERKQRLIEAGYDYDAVQAEVNRKLKGSSSGTAPVSTRYKVKTISGKPLRLRSEPNTSSKVLERMPNGTAIEVSEVKNGWAKTSYHGHNGYCSTSYLVKGG